MRSLHPRTKSPRFSRMQLIKILIGVILALAILPLFTNYTKASEGTTELRSTTGKDYRCFVASMRVGNYKILVGCRDLIYPTGSYVLWATSTEDDKPIKLGTLDYGRKEFSSNKAFSSLFVTIESSSKVKSPTGAVVMQGTTQPLSLLERPTTPTPTPEGHPLF